MKKQLASLIAVVNLLALPMLANSASAQSRYDQCVRDCSGGRQCIRACGQEYQSPPKQIKLPPTDIPQEDDKPVAKWINDALNPPGGGGGGGGGGGNGR